MSLQRLPLHVKSCRGHIHRAMSSSSISVSWATFKGQGERIQKGRQNGGWWKDSNIGSPFAGSVLTLALGSAAAASFFFNRETQCSAEKQAVSAARQEVRALITQADEMFLAKQYAALLEFLEGKQSESSEVELQWRYARALYDVADKTGGHTTAQKKALVEKAMGVIERALVAGGENFAVHKWHGIVLNKVGEYQGTKATIQNSFVVREHWQTAIRLNPKDATSHALLGEWCMSVAGLSAITRSVASAIFASPPTATYQEALTHFLDAEKIEPGFWLKNQINIAKCYLYVKDKESAKSWLEKIGKALASDDEDRNVQKEAAGLLAKTK